MSNSKDDNKKITTEGIEPYETDFVLDESNINKIIETKIKSSLQTENCIDMKKLDSGYTYEYKIVIIGAAGATIELVKTKKDADE